MDRLDLLDLSLPTGKSHDPIFPSRSIDQRLDTRFTNIIWTDELVHLVVGIRSVSVSQHDPSTGSEGKSLGGQEEVHELDGSKHGVLPRKKLADVRLDFSHFESESTEYQPSSPRVGF